MIAALLLLAIAAPAPFPKEPARGPSLSLSRPEGFWRQSFRWSGEGAFRIHLLLPGGRWIGFNDDGEGRVSHGRWWLEDRCRTLCWATEWYSDGGGRSRHGGGHCFSRMTKIG